METHEMPRKAAFHNAPPTAPLSSNAPVDAVKVDFARRLQAGLNEKGWNQAEFARRVAPHLPDLAFGRDSVSKYVRGHSLPSPAALAAMAKVLGRKPADLLPARGVPSAQSDNPPFSTRDLGDGMIWLKVNQAVTWAQAMGIMDLLKGEK